MSVCESTERAANMATVYLGIGSNIHPVENLQMAVAELRSRYGDVELSNVYRNASVGFDGAEFLNLVARIETDQAALEVWLEMEEIHAKSGREKTCARFVSRPLDIDLLLYDHLVFDEPPIRLPREDVLEYDFVLVPLAELADNYVHPITGRTIGEHLRSYDAKGHSLQRENLIL